MNRSSLPLDRLERHLDAAESHLQSARTIAAELRGASAIESQAKEVEDQRALAGQAMQIIEARPGLTLTQLQDSLRVQHRALRPAVDSLVRSGLVTVTVTKGRVRGRYHFPSTHKASDES